MIKATLFYSLILISLLGNICDCQAMGFVKDVGYSAVITVYAIGLCYVPCFGMRFISDTSNTKEILLSSLTSAIYTGAAMTGLMFWNEFKKSAEENNIQFFKYIQSRKVHVGALCYGILMGSRGISKLKDFLERRYG